MTQAKRVVVAMSGGVDSSVAAALLVRAGFDCTGVFMCLGQKNTPNDTQGCCSPQDAADARLVAGQLGIPFEVVDFRADMDQIIRYFIHEYRQGRTPNPCIHCNRRIKFGKLHDFAAMIGATYVATGHYARIINHQGLKRLSRAAHQAKDQSYALFSLDPGLLDHILLPVGDYTKPQIRVLAAEMDLPIHEKGESQEICFVPDDDYAGFIRQRAPELARKGPILNTSGRILGEHEGIYKFTIGQRRGLGVALGEPAYVVHLDAITNTVVLGTHRELHQQHLWANQVNWHIEPPGGPFPATVQIRYNHAGAPARVTPLPDHTVRVDFDQPVPAITPGQAAVFYDGNQCLLGGGWIDTPPAS